MLKLIKLYFFVVSKISPKMAANTAFKIFQKVRKKDIRKREQAFFDEAKHFSINFYKENIDCYEFGNNSDELVLLVHGWDSNAGCMYKFVDPLLKKGKKILAFNLPAHAFYKSNSTNIFEAKEALKTVLNNLPKHKTISIIAHSFGSATTAYALSELKLNVNELYFLTTPNHISDIFIDFKKMINLGDKAYHILINKANKILGEPLNELIIEKKLKQFKFNHLHLFHDVNDKIIPYKNSKTIAKSLNNATLHTYQKIGHYRMLWHDELIAKLIRL